MSYQGVFLTRGTDSGSEVDMGVVVGRPVDIEIVGGKLLYTTTDGNLFPQTYRMDSTGGATLKEVVDMEPVLNADGTLGGYLMLDRWGNVHAYGSATFMGNAKFVQEVTFGARKSQVVLPLAVDLEIVPGGYYILGSDGSLFSFDSTTGVAGSTTVNGITLQAGTGTSEDLGAVALNVDATGNYQVLLQNGTILFWSTALNRYTLGAPLYTQPNHPLVVDFTKAGEAFFLLDENGSVFSGLPDAVNNNPAQFEYLTGKPGFFDIEAGFLTE